MYSEMRKEARNQGKHPSVMMVFVAENSHYKLTSINATAFAYNLHFLPICSYKIHTCFEC